MAYDSWMQRLGIGLSWVVLAGALAACGDPAPRPHVSGQDLDGGSSAGNEAGADAPPPSSCKQAADTTCTQLLDCGAWVTVTQVQQDAPKPAGGKIDDGLYYMTKYIVYTGPGGARGPIGASFRETKRFSPNLLELGSESDKDPLSNFTITPSYEDPTATTPAQIIYNFDCPTKRRLPLPLSVPADKKSFDVFYQANWVATYTKVE